MERGGRASEYPVSHDQPDPGAEDILSVDDSHSPEHIDVDDDSAAPEEAHHDPLYPALADTRMGNDRFVHSSGDKCLVLVKFHHDNCPDATRCDPWQAFDFGPFLRKPDPLSHNTAPQESSALRRFRTVNHLVQTFQDPVQAVYEQEHGRWSSSEIRAAGARPVLGDVHVHWAGTEGRPSAGHEQGVSSNLLAMGCATDVKDQLEMIRRRGGRDWIEITYKTEVDNEEEDMDDGRIGGGGATISPSLGASAGDRNGGHGGDDTQMDSPSPPHRPSSSSRDVDPMHANEYDGDNTGGGGGDIDLDQELEALAYNNRSQSGTGSSRQQQQQQGEPHLDLLEVDENPDDALAAELPGSVLW
ncbi:hypothetical protein PG991_006585 [Apiospora marii]|uniref:Uncharacterized protein n=1 Tax=Apiospora marii TaxID=335849 RepID=A0ABR1S153_9PEZI